MPYDKDSLTFEQLDSLLAYDAETGSIRWKVKSAKKIMVGAEAGCVKATKELKDGKQMQYRYIRVLGKSMSAPRVAWMLHHGDWPSAKLLFNDSDPLNLKIENLRLANSMPDAYDHKDPGSRADYMREHREKFQTDWRDGHLRSTFGISLAEYTQMAVAQGGKCAICNCEETHTRGGKIKALAVDHDHVTGKVRGLLCAECNQALGKVKESRDTLVSMIKYLDKHSGRESITPTLTLVPTEDVK